MNQALIHNDYLALKEKLLRMWIPVTGARTGSDLWIKNFEKFASSMVNIDNITFLTRFLIDKSKLTLFRHNPHFESYFDSQPPFQLEEAILSGSFSEGLFLYATEAPDMDFMCVLKNIAFSQRDLENGSLSLTENTPFVYAYIKSKDTQELWSEFFDDADKGAGKYRLSSRKLKEKLSRNYRKIGKKDNVMFGVEQSENVTEGAAMTITKSEPTRSYRDCLVNFVKKLLAHQVNEPIDITEEYDQSVKNMADLLYNKLVLSSDIVLSINCEGWPSCAKEWITRERLWPDMQSVSRIAENGFHIVPKSSPDGDFRLSFPSAETMLIQTLSILQHKALRAFKMVVKHHQNCWSPTLKEVVSSYHLKNIAFWYFEKTSNDSWTEDSLVHHLIRLLEQLAKALRIQHVPMYFMPKVNLLKKVDDPEVTLELMEKITNLSHNFSAMSDAVDKTNSIEEIIGTEYQEILHIFDNIREIELKKANDGGKTCFTWYDLFDLIRNMHNS